MKKKCDLNANKILFIFYNTTELYLNFNLISLLIKNNIEIDVYISTKYSETVLPKLDISSPESVHFINQIEDIILKSFNYGLVFISDTFGIRQIHNQEFKKISYIILSLNIYSIKILSIKSNANVGKQDLINSYTEAALDLSDNNIKTGWPFCLNIQSYNSTNSDIKSWDGEYVFIDTDLFLDIYNDIERFSFVEYVIEKLKKDINNQKKIIWYLSNIYEKTIVQQLLEIYKNSKVYSNIIDNIIFIEHSNNSPISTYNELIQNSSCIFTTGTISIVFANIYNKSIYSHKKIINFDTNSLFFDQQLFIDTVNKYYIRQPGQAINSVDVYNNYMRYIMLEELLQSDLDNKVHKMSKPVTKKLNLLSKIFG